MRIQRGGGGVVVILSALVLANSVRAYKRGCVWAFRGGMSVRGGRLFVTTCTGALPSRHAPRNNSAVNTNTDGTVHLTDGPASRITVYVGALILCEL
jgi:hypothetical protein